MCQAQPKTAPVLTLDELCKLMIERLENNSRIPIYTADDCEELEG